MKKIFLVFGFVFVFLVFCFFTAKAAMIDIQETWTSSGDNSGTYPSFGYGIATAGDVNGDGYDDVLISTPYHDVTSGNDNSGKVYLYLGSASGLATSPAWTSLGDAQASAGFGSAIASAGDVNKDGYDDVIIGAHGYNSGVSGAGKAYLYLGNSSGLDFLPIWTSSGEDSSDAAFGADVVSVGDLNRDGYDDVVVGASGYSTPYNNGGKMYLYFGNSNGLSSNADWVLAGDQANAYFGSELASGDVNGDGYNDLIMGTGSYNSSTGKVYLYLGNSTGFSSAPIWTSNGEAANNRYGTAVSSGDVNGDGFNDVIIGAPFIIVDDIGKTYVFYGNASGVLSSTANWISVGDNVAGEHFGQSVSTAGDINADGYDDILVGSTAASAGKAYLYLGSASGLFSTAAWTSSGDSQIGQWYSYSVANAGDVNKDGYSEFLVGALDYDTAELVNAGKAYLYTNCADYGMLINSGNSLTNKRKVTLNFVIYNNPSEVIISENADFSGASWQAYKASKKFTLSKKVGKKTAYARFRDNTGVESKTVSNDIYYRKIVLDEGLKNVIMEGSGLVIHFKKLPDKLTKNNKYWMTWRMFKKYPKGWINAKATSLKRYWRLTTNLNKYKAKKKGQKFKIRVAFRYTKKLLRQLKKKNSSIKKKDLYLQYRTKNGEWKMIKKNWKAAKVLHKKKTRRFVVKYIGKFKQKKYFFAIGTR